MTKKNLMSPIYFLLYPNLKGINEIKIISNEFINQLPFCLKFNIYLVIK